ncbi:MAG: choice-of-anchor Q domain-containing protein, partial [Candidatus Limnocylindrales bacterium]
CNCGSSASLDINVECTVQADINAVGNTFEGSVGTGISLRNDLEPGGSIALDVFDNIISHQDFAGILLEDTGGTLTFRNGFNDLFQNGFNELDGASFAPSTLHVSPRFVDRTAGKLKLRSDSPLIDAGQVCTPGGVANPDAGGRHRLAGPTVDIGAYEFGAVVPTGGVFVGDDTPDSFGGTGGADIMCGYGDADVLDGAGGPDYVDGGGGGDILFGGGAGDLLFGQSGADLLCADDGHGNDRVDGGKGIDSYHADSGDTLISVEQQTPCVDSTAR